MTVRYLSAFEYLVNGVTSYLHAFDEDTVVATGFRARMQQGQSPAGANRVVFVPGELTGAGGSIEAPRDVGRRTLLEANVPTNEVRSLATWMRTIVISVWAVDGQKPRDELAQIVAVEALLERVVGAVETLPGLGGMNLEWGGTTWIVPKENTFGAEVLVTATLIHPLMDAPADIGTPGFTLDKNPQE